MFAFFEDKEIASMPSEHAVTSWDDTIPLKWGLRHVAYETLVDLGQLVMTIESLYNFRRVVKLFTFVVETSYWHMAELSQKELKAIRSYLLKKGLKTFRTTFKSRYLESESVNVTEVFSRLISKASDRGEKNYSLF